MNLGLVTPIFPCYLMWRTLVIANILGFSGSMTKLTSHPNHIVVGDPLCVLCAGDMKFSSGQKIRGTSLWLSRPPTPTPCPVPWEAELHQRTLTPSTWIQPVEAPARDQKVGGSEGTVRAFTLLLPSPQDQHCQCPLTKGTLSRALSDSGFLKLLPLPS